MRPDQRRGADVYKRQVLMQLIMSGMTFLGISGNTTYIIKGLVIMIACAIDMRKYLTKKYIFPLGNQNARQPDRTAGRFCMEKE